MTRRGRLAVAAGELQVHRGRAAQRAATTNALRADAPLLDTGALARVDAAWTAYREATEEVLAGEAAMATAVELEQRANRAAADALSALASQVDLTRLAVPHLADGGSITLTTGVLAREPIRTGAAAALARTPPPLG